MKKLIFFALAAIVSTGLMFSSCNNRDNGGEDDDTLTPTSSGIVGTWESEGENVAPLLVVAGITRITATFNANSTYTVISYTAEGSSTLEGTFAVEKQEGSETIFYIKALQNNPTALTSEGIFEITASGSTTTMKYEVAQTEPAIVGVTAPTVADGFGSTSGGAFGTTNIQTYVKTN